MRECKKLAKSGNMASAQMLAKSIAKSRKQVERIMIQQATMQDVERQVGHMASMATMSTVFEKSTSVMKQMGKLIKAPEISATMREMQAEMAKMGIVEEIVEDSLDVLEDDDIEEAADEEINKVLFDIMSAAGISLPCKIGAKAEAAAAPAATESHGRVLVGADGLPPPAPSGGGDGDGDGADGGGGGGGGGGEAEPSSAVADSLAARLASLSS